MAMASGVTSLGRTPDSKQTNSLASYYGRIATENQGFPAIIREQQVISHGNFWHVVRSFAFHMQSEGVTAGSLVALNTTDMLASLAILLATSLLGARFVTASKTLASAKILQPTHFFRSPEVTGNKRVDFKLIDDSWMPTPHSRTRRIDFVGNAAPDCGLALSAYIGHNGASQVLCLEREDGYGPDGRCGQGLPISTDHLRHDFQQPHPGRFLRAPLLPC